MTLIFNLLFYLIIFPFADKIETRDITISLLIIFAVVVSVSLYIYKARRKKLRRLLLSAKPYSIIQESDEELVSRSYQYLYNGNIEGAIECINKAIKIRPEKEDRYYIRGKLKFRIGDDEGAILDFSKAISLNPDNAYAYYQRGIINQKMGLLEESEMDFDAANRLGFIPSSENTIPDIN